MMEILFILAVATSCSAQILIHEPNSIYKENNLNILGTPPTEPLTPLSGLNQSQDYRGCTTDMLIGTQNLTTRAGIPGRFYRWRAFNVWVDPAWEQHDRDLIANATQTLQEVLPCVRFGVYPRDAKPRGDYIKIVKGRNTGCSSWVGRIGGAQTIYLESPSCWNPRTILHEMVHALGFGHEHNRYDRNQFVTINWNNIRPGYVTNFYRNTWSTYGVPYDQNSIMHYAGWEFRRNRESTTITAKNGQPIGNNGTLTEYDKRKLKAMYNC